MKSHWKRGEPGRNVVRLVAATAALGGAASMLLPPAPTEAAPPDSIGVQNLPWNRDMEWQVGENWQATGQWAGTGPEETTKCLRGDPGTELDAERLYQRDYAMHDGAVEFRASALVMEFDSNQVADAAYGTLATWATECSEALLEKGQVLLEDEEGHPLSIPGTEARFTELYYTNADGGDSEDASLESIGAVRNGNKIALVSMDVYEERQPDWAYPGDGSGQPLHPMIRTMPQVANRLVV